MGRGSGVPTGRYRHHRRHRFDHGGRRDRSYACMSRQRKDSRNLTPRSSATNTDRVPTQPMPRRQRRPSARSFNLRAQANASSAPSRTRHARSRGRLARSCDVCAQHRARNLAADAHGGATKVSAPRTVLLGRPPSSSTAGHSEPTRPTAAGRQAHHQRGPHPQRGGDRRQSSRHVASARRCRLVPRRRPTRVTSRGTAGVVD